MKRKGRIGLAVTTLVGAMGMTQFPGAASESKASTPHGDVEILRITPQGKEVPAGRQIVVTFDRPMKALGEMSVDAEHSPVTLTPTAPCSWHWLDPRSLACELPSEQPLLPAMTYELTVREGMTAEDGNVLRKVVHTQFSTERPIVKSYSFHTWLSPGTPKVQLVFNQPVSHDSVAAHVHFSGQQSSIVEPAPYDRYPSFRVLPLPGEKEALLIQESGRPGPTPGESNVARRTWLVSPPEELPRDAKAQLTIEPGLRSYAGALEGVEQRTVVQFDTFPTFRFLGIHCRAPEAAATIAPAHPDSAPRCNPLAHVSLMFSAPVSVLELRDHLKLDPDLAGGRTDYNPWENVYPVDRLGQPHQRGQTYEVQLPEHLQAFKNYSLAGLAAVKDDFGRPLQGPTAMKFGTDHRTPRLRLTGPVAILEKNAPTDMPLYVTNLTAVDLEYDRLTPDGVERQLKLNQKVTRVWDIAYATPLSIRGLLGGRSGVIDGKLLPRPTPPVVDRGTYFDDDDDEAAANEVTTSRRIFGEVTPFSVHTKLGHYNTLVWVTSLATGLPVEKAHVRIYESSNPGLTDKPNILAEATTDKSGIAMLPGREQLDPVAAKMGYESFPYPGNEKPLMVRVDAVGDMAVLPLDGDFSINTYMASRWQFGSSAAHRDGHVRAWGTTAQGVYKLGDTVQYKIYVRNENNRSLSAAPKRTDYDLQIQDPTGKTIQEMKSVELNEFGAYSGEFKIPPNGAVGSYQFVLVNGDQQWLPMETLVADFTPAPFHVQNTLNGSVFEPGDTVEVATRATLHAGGPYADAGSRVTARAYPEEPTFNNPLASGFYFEGAQSVARCGRTERERDSVVHQSEDKIDQQGELNTKFVLDDASMVYGRLEVESAVRDDRGKYVAARSSAGYRGRDRYVGLRNDKWSLEEGKPAAIEFLVMGKDGKVQEGVPVTFSVEGQQVTASRVKGAGNAYLTSYNTEWISRGACVVKSGKTAQRCTFTPSSPGLYSIQARVDDTHGRTHTTELCTWVTGKGRLVWEEPADMSLSVVPEKKTYHVGDRARYLVRNPYPGARALVTIERLGVIKSWVQVLEGNTPVIEVPIEPDDLPGFYLSVVVMSPRVAPAPGTDPIDGDGVDLGRPTYRIGYVETEVTDCYKTLDVHINSGKKTYKPGDTVTLELDAHAHGKTDTAEPVEFAVAVLDESVFDLIQDGKKYFDPYSGFYRLDSLDVFNFGLLNRLVGLQKFEKKGANAGGDGGAGFDMRVVKNYVAYWNPSAKADAKGHARVEFKLPDNLTGWRVFAVAVTPTDRLGLGDYKFVSTKLTEIQPVMPNQVTQGDHFTAGFNVLNRDSKARTVNVALNATGVVEGGKQSLSQAVTLEPFQRRTVSMPLATVGQGSVHLTATASDSIDHDGLAYTVPVHARVSLDTAASYGTTLTDPVTESIDFPKDMMPNTGSVSVVLSPTVIGNLEGAIGYIRDYPYDCWEQKLTRALIAADFVQLHDYFSPTVKWPEATALPQAVLDDAASYQAPNGGMGFFAAQDDRVSPYLSAATALGFNQLRKAGYKIPEDVENRLHAYLERLLREKTVPTFYSEGMVSSVRAVALQALAESPGVTLADLRRYSGQVQSMDLFGMAAYLSATLKVQGADNLSAQTAQSILAHANQSGGKFQFTERWDDGFHQLLATEGRSQCAILQAFLAYGRTTAGAKLVGDVPFKLVREITQSRGSRDYWQNTQENLYCLNALVDFSRDYEKDTPQVNVHTTLGGHSLGDAKFTAFRDPPAVLARSNGAADAGTKAELRIEPQGSGRIYYAARLQYSLNDTVAKPTNAGIEVVREYSVQRDGRWQLLSSPMRIKRGELIRVDLFVDAPAARNFVVVDDPVPGGLEPVNRELATASTVDADQGEFQAAGGSFWFKYADWSEYGIALWDFYHRELRHDSARFYADYLSAGHYHLSYAAQAIASGEFAASPTKAEEMYDPDVYGKSYPGQLIVHDPDDDAALSGK